MRSKQIKILLLILAVVAIGWAYKMSERHREIQEIFRNPEDLAWASQYLDRTINLCNAPWEETVIIRSGGKDVYLSPSGRYEIKWNSSDDDAYFSIVDAKSDHPIEDSAILSRYLDAQWTLDERFLIFSPAIAKDEWWIQPKIFISDTVTGKTIYFGKSKFYECEMKDL